LWRPTEVDEGSRGCGGPGEVVSAEAVPAETTIMKE